MIDNLDSVGAVAAAVLILYSQQARIWKRLERLERGVIRIQVRLGLDADSNEKEREADPPGSALEFFEVV